VGCVAAMLTKTSLEDFQAWAGHEAPYCDDELVIYCAERGVWVGIPIFNDPLPTNRKAVLTVGSKNFADADHCVLFLGGDKVADPLHSEIQPLENYEVVNFSQIGPLRSRYKKS
jgi:hypothetical protein